MCCDLPDVRGRHVVLGVTGGIAVKGLIAGTTRNNVLMLVVGTLLSSWIGTTGSASSAWRRTSS